MEKVIEKQSLGRYYLQTFANGIKRFTQSKWMVAIVNGFIAVMPIIITASIFTLLSALPEMVMTIIWQKEGPTAWKDHIDYAMFEQYQAWAGAISNWSMGIIGLLATAAIAKNLAVELNNKLPFERRMNETAIFFAAICVYFMLSVIEFSVGDNDAWKAVMPDHTGRAIFVDGLAAQGILPGIIIGLTLPYVFYISYKKNWTIRLPKSVPQTICQAFLAIIPLFLTFAIFGSIGFGFNKWLGEPILFFIFEKIQTGLSANPNINNSYGLIVIYTLMEGGFWFLGVHPEPVHAIMRATFWFSNIADNAHGGNNLFIEPLMYGYGAMGGSGCTLMLPALALLFCRSTQMKVTGKTAVLPIFFQVNEPALFGTPTILNPLFAFPMIFTGMFNDLLFKAFADATAFQAGTLYLPWSTPYFLQTALPTPTNWMPWVFNIIALAICTLTYLPAVILHDKNCLKEEAKKLNINSINFKPQNGIEIIKSKLFIGDPTARNEHKIFKKQLNKKTKKAIALVNGNDQQKSQIKLAKKIKLLKNKAICLSDELAIVAKSFELTKKNKKAKLNAKLENLSEKVDLCIDQANDKKNAKIQKLNKKLETLKAKISTFKQISSQSKSKLTKKITTKGIANTKVKIEKIETKIASKQSAPAKVHCNVKDIDVVKAKETHKIETSYANSCIRANKKFARRHKVLQNKADKLNIKIAYLNVPTALKKFKNVKAFKKANKKQSFKEIISKNKAEITQCKNPWAKVEKEVAPSVVVVTTATPVKTQKTAQASTNGIDPNKKYQVLVLCLGAGSSAVLANTINKGLKANSIKNIKAAALAWGQHESALASSDLVILSPQLGSHANNLSKQAQDIGFKLLACRGRDYIDLSKNPANAADIVIRELTSK